MVLIAYFPAPQLATFSIGAATRKDGKAVLQTNHLKDNTAETWIGFISHTGEEASDSIHTGNISV